jgi:predicted nucleic acid-binding protein
MTYALDTNIISYLLRGEGEVDKYFEQEIVNANNLYVIPPVVVFEIRRWLLDKPDYTLKKFAQEFELLYQAVRSKSEMPPEAWEKSAEIYIRLKQTGQMLGAKDILAADILIAAYCIINDYTLVTNNIRHFERIEGLKTVNWVKRNNG